jgi:GNAT superfamily N-acetyltransferase
MGVSTRPLDAADWPAFWPMLHDMGTDDAEGTARARYEVLMADPRWAIIGADQGVGLVGYAAVQDYGPHLRLGNLHRIARLHDLYVQPASRRLGVGTALMKSAQTWASAHVRYLEWQAGQTSAAPFYERLGYHGNSCPQPDFPTFVVDLQQG